LNCLFGTLLHPTFQMSSGAAIQMLKDADHHEAQGSFC
jgi:hypothetical protein